MDLRNLDLKQILQSPKPGMDLKKGVPGKEGKVDAKFEGQLRTMKKTGEDLAEANPKTPASHPNQLKSKSDDQPIKTLPSKQASVRKDAETSAGKAEQKPIQDSIDESSPKQEVVESVNSKELTEAIALPVMVEKGIEKEPVEKEAASEECSQSLLNLQVMMPMDVKSVVNQPTKGDGEILNEQMVDFGSAPESGVVQETPNLAVQTTQAPKVLTTGSDKTAEKSQALEGSSSKTRELSNDLELSDSTLFASASEVDQEPSEGFGSMGENEGKKGTSLKSLADSLWVNANLDGGATNQSVMLSTPQKVEVTQASASASAIRSNLMTDMKPLIQHVMTTQDGGTMTLSLRPGNLGLVQVDVKVDAGDVRVAIHAERPQAKEMLQSEVRELKEHLTNAGLNVQDVSVQTMRSSGAEFNRNPNPQNQQSDPREQPSQPRRQAEQESKRAFEETIEGQGKEAA